MREIGAAVHDIFSASVRRVLCLSWKDMPSCVRLGQCCARESTAWSVSSTHGSILRSNQLPLQVSGRYSMVELATFVLLQSTHCRSGACSITALPVQRLGGDALAGGDIDAVEVSERSSTGRHLKAHVR